MSQFSKFYFTSSVLNMFRILIHPSSGACDFLLYHHIGCVFLFRHVLEFRCGHTGTPAHVEIRTRNQSGDTTEKSQAPDNGCINIRNMLSIEEVK